MKKGAKLFLIVLITSISFTMTNCREKSTAEKIGDGIEEVGEDIEEGAEEIKDEIEDAIDDN